MRPSAHHDGTDPPRLTFDARLEKRKTGRRVAAGRFRSCLTTPQITSVRSDLASSRGGCQSAWRGRHAKRCKGQLRIITAVPAGQSFGGAATDDRSVRAGAVLRSSRGFARIEHALPLAFVLHLRDLTLPLFASRCSGMMFSASPLCCDVTVEKFHRAYSGGQRSAPYVPP